MTLPLKKQVCSLELSRKLKEAGVPQESLFYWEETGTFFDNEDAKYTSRVKFCPQAPFGYKNDTSYKTYTSAFTVAELDVWLMRTDYAVIAQHGGHWVFERKEGTTLQYNMMGGHGMGPMLNGSNRRASMLHYLIQEGLIDPKTLSL